MYLFKKNIILVPADYDGVSMAKGILSLDCYADKTVCSLRTYNLFLNTTLTLGIAINKKLHKVKVDGSKNSQKFDILQTINNTDNISIVLLDILPSNYQIVLWGSTELNTTWRSTLEFMVQNEFKNNLNVESAQQPNVNCFLQQQTEQNSFSSPLPDNKDNFNFQQTPPADNEYCKPQQTPQGGNNFFNEQASGSSVSQTLAANSNLFNQADAQNGFLQQDGLGYKTTAFNNGLQNNGQTSNQQNTEILKNKSLNEFLDGVLSVEPNEDQAYYDESSSHLNESPQPENTFYSRISYQIDKMFDINKQEKVLDDIIPNSKFCRVEFDDNSGHYVFGVVYENNYPKYLCYGVPAKKDNPPPPELSGYYQWLPVDVDDANGNGYYMMYQDATNGQNISVEII